MFNSLVAKEEGTVKMVDGSACEIISTGTINITCRDEMVRALEAVRHVLEARYNLISIGVLDEEGCRIQVLQGVITVSKGDRIILEGEKHGEIYKLKKENTVQGGVSMTSLEGSSSRGGASRKTAMGREPDQNIAGKRKSAFGQA